MAELSEAHVSVNFYLIQNKISCNEDCIALLLHIGFFYDLGAQKILELDLNWQLG